MRWVKECNIKLKETRPSDNQRPINEGVIEKKKYEQYPFDRISKECEFVGGQKWMTSQSAHNCPTN
jgi:hypothetical protein